MYNSYHILDTDQALQSNPVLNWDWDIEFFVEGESIWQGTASEVSAPLPDMKVLEVNWFGNKFRVPTRYDNHKTLSIHFYEDSNLDSLKALLLKLNSLYNLSEEDYYSTEADLSIHIKLGNTSGDSARETWKFSSCRMTNLTLNSELNSSLGNGAALSLQADFIYEEIII